MSLIRFIKDKIALAKGENVFNKSILFCPWAQEKCGTGKNKPPILPVGARKVWDR